MKVEIIVFLWLGLALLFTFALCRVAGGPIPEPGDPDESEGSGRADVPSS